MSINRDVNSLNITSGRVELFDIDCSALPGVGIIYYMTNNLTSVMFNGIEYLPFPLQITGIERISDGAPARPSLEISNLTGFTGEIIKLIGSLAFLHEDLVGIKVIYRETFEKYLNTSSAISAPPQTYTIGKKLQHNKLSLRFELRSPLDKERAYMPKNQMLKKDFPGLGINKRV